MNFPQELYYTSEHEWVKVEGDIAIVGITDFAQSELGDIVYVDIATVGDDLAQNDIFGSVEAVKTVSDLFMPLSGQVLEFNTTLDDSPELVNSDAFGEGWIIRIKMSNPNEVQGLLSADAYKALVGK